MPLLYFEILWCNWNFMLDANKKREMMEGIVKDIMQRMKDQGMSEEDILKTIEKISKQSKEDEQWPTKKDFTP